MSILIGGQSAPKAQYIGSQAVVKQYVGDDLVWKKSRLPDGYQEVEYIESHGTEYIKTGYAPHYTNFTLDASFTRTDKEMLTGLHWTSSHGFAIGIVPNISNSSFVALSGLSSASTGSIAAGDIDTNRHTFVLERQEDLTLFSVDSTTNEKATAFTPSSGSEIYLFARSRNTYADDYCEMILYGADIADALSGLKGRDFVPCYRISDGEVGLYDLCGSICPLTGTPFYTNAGTGTFAKGNDIY